jgi:hypothetical protein
MEEFGIRKAEKRAKSIAQSVQKVENKRITTEGHGTTRKEPFCEYLVSV